MKNKLLSALVLGILILMPGCRQSALLHPVSPAVAGMSADRLNRIDTLLNQGIRNGWVNGAVAYIARNGNIVYEKAFGMDDPAAKKAMQTNAIFRIASQTKAITSVAVMILFEEGKLLLDDPVSRYIPEFAHPVVLDQFNAKDSSYTTVPANREITIRDLLTHTSGIDYPMIGSHDMTAIYAKAGIPVGFVSRPLLLGDQMKKLARLPLVHQPGDGFTYGLSVDVLGYVVEVVSGINLDRFMHQRIFEPLGMKDTYFYLPVEKQSRLVQVYTEDANHNPVKWTANTAPGVDPDYPLAKGTYYSGGAGLSSTIEDYAVFLQMLLNGGEYNGQRILSRRTVDLMTSNQIGDLNLGKDKFGLGFEITTKAGQAKLGISEGSFAWGGFFSTTYWADPEEKLVGLLFMQQAPLTHSELQDKFKAMVYAALDD